MARYTRRPKAETDLLEIWLYIAQDSPRAADRLLDRIEAQCRLLADNPRLGRPRPEIAPEARAWTVDDISSFTARRMTGSRWCASSMARARSSRSSSEAHLPSWYLAKREELAGLAASRSLAVPC